jgi:enoyl-CoA hydratase/carnithine racemase
MRFTSKLLPSRSGNLGVFTLNNPPALHALSLDMMHGMQDFLQQWHADDTIAAVLIKSSHNTDTKTRAFCAGGDVKKVYLSGKENDNDINRSNNGATVGKTTTTSLHGQGVPDLASAEFFRQEYIVNHMIATAPKPQISFWDGIVMGGGVGISIHGKYRVATEHAVFAMPETRIGLFPDVGSMYWMPRMLPHSTAVFLALTGQRLHAADLLYTGVATHFVPSHRLDDLEDALVTASRTLKPTTRTTAAAAAAATVPTENVVAPVLMSFHEIPPKDLREKAYLAREKAVIDKVFGILPDRSKNVEDIVASLENLPTCDFAQQTLRQILQMSPTSLKVTLEGLRRGAEMASIGDDLRMEFRMAQAFMRPGTDFYEGIRAALIDKDGKPQWSPSTLAEVTDEMVQEYFRPIAHEWAIPQSASTSSSDSSKL